MTHGTHSNYAHGCRCPFCKDAHREYIEKATRDRAYYGPSLGSATNYRAMLRRLTLPEMTLAEIAHETGIKLSTLEDIRAGRSGKVQRRTRDALDAFALTLPTEREDAV